MTERSPKDLLREARERKGFRTMEAAAAKAKMPIGSYRSYENGSRPITLRAAKIFQDAFGVDAKSLVPGVVRDLALEGNTAEPEFVGDAAVGLWRDNSYDSQKIFAKPRVTIASPRSKTKKQAVRIADESMNRILKMGWFAIFEEPESDDPRDYPEQTLLVIDRMRGSLVERSVRRVEKSTKDQCVLACFSTDKRFAERINYPPRSKNESIVVVGRVTGGSFDL